MLKKPRRIMMLVMAGKPVDDFIETILPHVEKGDIIIDGGNSHFPDTTRRTKYLASKGIRFVGTGVSGGEEGARFGPSLMPGGNEEAWPFIKEIFQNIAAKSDGEPCCEWVGDEGAGHYVKMVHNGIEYGDMQLICEVWNFSTMEIITYYVQAYDIMKRGLGMPDKEIGDVLTKWNKGVLDSFLIEITRDIMYFNDDDGTPLVEKILDSAGQKGTGKWTAINALDLGMPVTLIAEAVLARCLSSVKAERTKASGLLSFIGRSNKFEGDKGQFLEDLEQALYASKIISYAQGFMLMQEVSQSSNRSICGDSLQYRLPRNTSGSSTNHPSLLCGEEAASSDLFSLRTSLPLTAITQNSRTYYSTTSSTRLSTRRNLVGETSSRRLLC